MNRSGSTYDDKKMQCSDPYLVDRLYAYELLGSE